VERGRERWRGLRDLIMDIEWVFICVRVRGVFGEREGEGESDYL